MNIPTWIIAFISIVYAFWSLVEIIGFTQFMELERKGYNPRYSTFSKLFTFAWFFIGVAAICYFILG